MTIVASLLFLSAIAASAYSIAMTIGRGLPRVREIIEAEFGPAVKVERRISFGPVRNLTVASSANIVVFPLVARTDQEFKLAA